MVSHLIKQLTADTEIDPFFATPPQTLSGSKDLAAWGPIPPEWTDLDDVCLHCPPVSNDKCRDSGLGMFDVLGGMDIRPLCNDSYPGFVKQSSRQLFPLSSSLLASA
jgi:hypothetical protein